MGMMRALQKAKAKEVEKALGLSSKSARTYGVSVAALMKTGRQPGRMFTTMDIEKACDVVTADMAETFRKKCAADGVPSDLVEGMLTPLLKRSRADFRRGLCAALPAEMVASEGTG